MATVLMETACPISKPTACYWKKIWKGLNVMRQNWEFCDVILISNDNKHFMAHRAMLVASSFTFMNYFSSDESKNKFDSNSKTSLYFQEVPSDVLQVVLDFIYGITPTTPFNMLKLCAGSKYFGIEEAYEYSMKYFGESNFQSKLQNPHLVLDQKAPSIQSAQVQDPSDNQAKNQSAMNKGPVTTPFNPPKNTSHFQGILSPDVTDSDSNDGKVEGMAELSLSDLALGNECPHLKKLVGQTGNAVLDFDMELTERLDLKDKHCLNELDEIINSEEGMNELPNFLNVESRSANLSPEISQKQALQNGPTQKYLEVKTDSICDGSDAYPNKNLDDDFFHIQLDDLDAPNIEKSISPACPDTPVISEIFDRHLIAIGSVTDTSYDSDSYPHMLCDNNASSSNENLQNIYQDSSDDLRIQLNELADLANTSVIRHDNKSKAQNCLPGKTLKFMCSDCGEAFATSYKLQTHQLKQHNKGKLFSCLHCPFKSPRKKDLQAHSLSQHGEKPPGVKIYACSSCSYECIDKNRFEEHEAIHQGVLKYNCPLCSKGYTTRRGMKTHLKYHNQSRPFKCTLCPSDFKVKSKLTDHMKLIHFQKGVKPYKCGYCEHYTALRGNCNQHIKKNHPGQPVLVIDTMSSTRRHVKNYDYANLQGSDIDELHEICSTQFVRKV